MHVTTNQQPGVTAWARSAGPILVTPDSVDLLARSLAGRAPSLFAPSTRDDRPPADPIQQPFEDALDAFSEGVAECLRAFEEGAEFAERTVRMGGIRVHVSLYSEAEDDYLGEYSICLPERVSGLGGRLRRHLLAKTERKVSQESGLILGSWTPPREWIASLVAARELA